MIHFSVPSVNCDPADLALTYAARKDHDVVKIVVEVGVSPRQSKIWGTGHCSQKIKQSSGLKATQCRVAILKGLEDLRDWKDYKV